MKQFLFTFFILLLISLFATNCNTEHYNFDNSDKYYKYDISFPIKAENFSSRYFKYCPSLNNFCFYSKDQKIFIFSFEGELMDSINLNIKKNLDDFYVLNNDSIYLSIENENRILLISKNGNNLLKEYKLEIKNLNKPFYTYNYKNFPLEVRNNLVYTYHYLDNETSKDNLHNYFSNPRELIFHLSDTLHLVSKIGKFPSNYISENYLEMNPMRTFGYKNNIVYSFESSDSLYLYDGNEYEHKLLKSINLKTKYFKKNKQIDEDNIPKENYFEEITKYVIENDRYGDLYFCYETNNYFRTLKIGAPYKNGDGTKKQVEDCPWLLLKYNNEFDLISSVKFQPSHYSIYSMILLKNNNFIVPYLINKNENETKFAVFNFD